MRRKPKQQSFPLCPEIKNIKENLMDAVQGEAYENKKMYLFLKGLSLKTVLK